MEPALSRAGETAQLPTDCRPAMSCAHADDGTRSLAKNAGTSALAVAYVGWLNKHQRRLRWSFVFLFVLGVVLAPLCLSNMVMDVAATRGTYSDIANTAIREHFPGKIADVVLAIVVSRRDGGLVLGGDRQGGDLESLTRHLERELAPWTSPSADEEPLIARIDSWCSFRGLGEAQRPFLSNDGAITVLLVSYNTLRDQGRVVPAVRRALDSAPQLENFEALMTGIGPLDQASLEGVVNNLVNMDSIAFPAALVLLGPVLRSWQLMVLPVVGIVFAATLCFGVIMYPVCLLYDVFILSSSIMMSLLIAVSIDYSLFILSRYRAELLASHGPSGMPEPLRAEAAVATTVWNAGHAVLVSGATLTFAFVGLILSGDPFLMSTGIACSAGLIAAMFSALVVTPTLLLSWPNFFNASVLLPCKSAKVGRELADRSLSQSFELGDQEPGGSRSGRGDDDASSLEREAETLVNTRWYSFTSWILSNKLLVSLAVAIMFVPSALRLPQIEFHRSPMFFVPRGNDAALGFTRLFESFGAGLLWPTNILVVPPPGETVFSEAFFGRVASLIDTLPNQLPLSPEYSIHSIVYSSDVGSIPFGLVREALTELSGPAREQGAVASAERQFLCNVTAGTAGVDACELIRMARSQFVNAEGTAMILNVVLHGDPWTPDGTQWIHALRSAFGDSTTDRYYVVSNPSSVSDTVDGVFGSMLAVVIITFLGVFALVSISFKSIVVPLRLIPSIVLTIVWSYGLAVIVYQDGLLQWTGLNCLAPIGHELTPGVSWILPPLCFTLLTGLCLDYDIYVLTRVVEFRLAGFTDRDSVLLGVSSTGPTITTAGCIMMVAFSGLMMSNQLLLNQLSFFLLGCVLIDTFIVRNIVVPLCMDVLGGFSNWWPREMPTSTRQVPSAKQLVSASLSQ